jgi:uncharacterized protein (TIGR03083 family)
VDDGPITRELRGAAFGFSELVGQIGAGDWGRPALGEWDVRALVGHTGRALSTVEVYLEKVPTGPPVENAVEYYLKMLSNVTDPDLRGELDRAVAERGREAGAALGDDPASEIEQLAERVVGVVDRTPGDAPLATPAGTMTLAAYLPTRTFELAVHSLDLARATGLEIPPNLLPAIASSCELAGAIAGRLPSAPDLLLLMTGREGLPEHLSVL